MGPRLIWNRWTKDELRVKSETFNSLSVPTLRASVLIVLNRNRLGVVPCNYLVVGFMSSSVLSFALSISGLTVRFGEVGHDLSLNSGAWSSRKMGH